MMLVRRLAISLTAAGALFALSTGSALAQGDAPAASGPSNPSGTTESTPGSANQPPTTESYPSRGPRRSRRGAARQQERSEGDEPSAESWSATVRVSDGVRNEPVKRTGVLLKASPPVGPFQRRKPEPVETWEAVTNAEGVAEFRDLPGRILQENLELYAVTSSSGIEFKSARKAARDGADLDVSVYPRASSADGIVVERLRTIFQPWEDYLVVNQRWNITVDGKRAVDTTALPGERFEKGLPVELPLKSQGIKMPGPGESEIVDNTAYWKGVVRPGETVSLRVRFSVSAASPTHVFRQSVQYPVRNVEAILPLQTEHEKVPRLDDATMAAKGFERVEATRRIPGLRSDNEYLYATDKSLPAGDSFAVRMTGLPFEQPIAPWVVVGLGVFGIGLILVFARRGAARLRDDETTADAIEVLENERQELLDELAEIERAFERDDVSEITYETESLRLRERLSLIMNKLDELRDSE